MKVHDLLVAIVSIYFSANQKTCAIVAIYFPEVKRLAL